jgi:sterol desaturase/sphingolipid hydroxylase (fatty acid hydroxylase superfamily)
MLAPLTSTIEAAYSWVWRLVGGDAGLLFYGALHAWGLLVFVAVGGAYLCLDLSGPPRWAARFKVQHGANEPLDRAKLARALQQIAFNQLIVAWAFAFALAHALRWRGNPVLPEHIYWGPRLLWDLACIVVLEEIGFYYSHRLAHENKFLYKNVHKRHHEWTAPIAITAVYAHPLEHIMSNLLPIALGPFVSGCHAWIVFLWVGLAIATTLTSHSGYHFPLLGSPQQHDLHHKLFSVNYGVMGWLDALHGTDDKFRGTVHQQRHKIFLSTTPIDVQIPNRAESTSAAAPAAASKQHQG